MPKRKRYGLLAIAAVSLVTLVLLNIWVSSEAGWGFVIGWWLATALAMVERA